MIVLILNGRPRSGKDEFISACMEEWNCMVHSTIDTPKYICRELGWNGSKGDRERKMLVELKRWWVKHFDGPYQEVVKNIYRCSHDGKSDIFFTVSREGNEIKRIKDWCRKNSIDCVYLYISRDGNGHQYGTESDDQPMKGCVPDKYITNNGWLSDYHNKAREIVAGLLIN